MKYLIHIDELGTRGFFVSCSRGLSLFVLLGKLGNHMLIEELGTGEFCVSRLRGLSLYVFLGQLGHHVRVHRFAFTKSSK